MATYDPKKFKADQDRIKAARRVRSNSFYFMDDRDNGDLSPARADRWTHLAAGILSQGAKMAVKERNVEAIYWLLSPQAELLAFSVEISYSHIRHWALSQVEIMERAWEKFAQQNALFYIGDCRTEEE